MKKYIYILFLFCITSQLASEEILRSAVIPLSEEDYNKTSNQNCKAFSDVLKAAKNEWSHIIPYKLTEKALLYFIKGYNMQEELKADIVTIWPSYQGRRDQYYVLIGYNNCFVKWIELLPNSIQEIINNGANRNVSSDWYDQ
tara:strand:+ start:344 stop:769 length:426 start_codon:yes stop_codon:yes gene_type:complete